MLDTVYAYEFFSRRTNQEVARVLDAAVANYIGLSIRNRFGPPAA